MNTLFKLTLLSATFALGAGSMIDVQEGVFGGGSNANEVWTNNLAGLNVASGAIFNGVEANVRADALTGAGTVTSGYPGAGYENFTFGVNNGSGTFSGTIQNTSGAGAIALTKVGTGTQTLSGGSNSWNGTTSIGVGTLTLSGTLSTTGSVAINGHSGPVLNITGNLTKSGGSGNVRTFQIGATAGTAALNSRR